MTSEAVTMQVRLLGPVEVWDGAASVGLGPPRERCVLAVLAMTPGQPVTPEALVDRVWGDRLPERPREALYTHVSRLRTPVRRAGGELRRRDGGYVLEIDRDRVDLHRSRQLAERARALAARPAHDGCTAQVWREACGLWRALPLTGLPGDWAARMRHGLERERLAMLAERFEVELRAGRYAAAVGPLSAALAEHPLAESLAGQLMRALYGAGRAADALAVYARVRQRLVAEIGDEPGAPLRDLHAQMLRRDPALLAAGTTRAGGEQIHAAAPVVPAQLPPDPAPFVGRSAQLARLDALLSQPGPVAASIVAIEGMAGVGKTALAVHWAHRVRDRFPDGQLYVDMYGHAAESGAPPVSPVEVVGRFLRDLGVPAGEVPGEPDEAAALYRSLLADRRVLVVLDNVADPGQVRPLLPGGVGCAVLVTSRKRLAGLAARDGAALLPIDVLPDREAIALLARTLGPHRLAAEPAAAAELAALCGRLPLALRIAGANLTTGPQRPIADYVSQLRGDDRLAALVAGDDAQAAVRVAFDASYRRLEPALRRIFRLLGLLPGPDASVAAAAALAGTAPQQARDRLAALAAAHLLEEHRTGRYTCHDLVRAYARDRVRVEESAAERDAARRRLYGFYQRETAAADLLLYPHVHRWPPAGQDGERPRRFADPAEALGWLDAERANLVEAIHHAAAQGHAGLAWPLADALRGYLLQRGCISEGRSCLDAGLAAARAAGEAGAQARLLLARAGLGHRCGRLDETVADLHRAGQLAADAGWVEGRCAVLANLATVSGRLGRLDRAVGYGREALRLYAQLGSPYGQAVTLGNLADDLVILGRLREAVGTAARAARTHAELGSPLGEASSLATVGRASRLLGDLPAAVRHLARARSRYRAGGDRGHAASTAGALAMVYCDAGHTRRALDLSHAAWRLAEQAGDAEEQVSVLNVLAAVQVRRGDYAAARGHSLRARELAGRISDRHAEVEALLGLAAADLGSGAHRPGHQRVDEALSISRSLGYRLLEGQALALLAEVCLAQGWWDRATGYAESALAIHRETGCRLAEAATRQLLGTVARDTSAR